MSSPTTFPIRAATLRDAKAIAEIHNAAHGALAQTGLAHAQPGAAVSLEQRQAYWREAIEFAEPQVRVATDGDTVVGFVGFDRSRDEGTPPTMGEIWAIYVLPSCWSRGAGPALWDAAREGLQEEGCTHVSIWLPLTDERALRFHALAGFKQEMSSARTQLVDGARVEEIRLKRPL
jgi:ribosomal protein S18 acetylase RimI-like enzyme